MLFFLLILGFILLIKGADFLVDGASSFAKRFHVSDLAIGLTVVAFGTSSPELLVNIMAGIEGSTEIAVGNILGSNIANVFLILGVSAVIYPLKVSESTVWKEIPFNMLAVIVLTILANDLLIDGKDYSVLSRSDGLILLSFFTIFLYYSASIAKRIPGMEDTIAAKQYDLFKSIFLILSGLAGLILGGHWIVISASGIAARFGMSQSFIGLTIVAIGTSLPELATSAMAAYKRNVEIAVGAVVGSNIFNIFFVLGVSSVINPLPFQEKSNIDLSVVILSTILLFVTMFSGKRHVMDRWQGIIFLLLYAMYLCFLIISG